MNSRTTNTQLLVVLFFSTISVVSGLDLRVVNTTCDPTLPLTADIYLQCNGDARCTFGEVSKVYGKCTLHASSHITTDNKQTKQTKTHLLFYPTVYYNGVENSGIQDNVGYLSADLSLFGMDFNLCTMQQVPLCDDTMVADENNANGDCPADGTFAYSIQYTLPSSGPEAASWLATGWRGSGLVQMYAEQDESMKIGECVLQLQTLVTQQHPNSLLGTPSAAVSTGMVLAGMAVLMCMCCYCYCCRRGGRKRPTQIAVPSKADVDSYFKRLEEDKSYWSGSKKSGVSKKSSRTKKTADPEASVVSELE